MKFVFAEPLCSVTRKQLWCVVTVRQCCASLLVGVPGSPRVALSGGRGTDALLRTLLTLISLSTREPLKVDFMEEKKWVLLLLSSYLGLVLNV